MELQSALNLSGATNPSKLTTNMSSMDIFAEPIHSRDYLEQNNGTVILNQFLGAAPIFEPVHHGSANSNLGAIWDSSIKLQEATYLTRTSGDVVTEAAVDFYRHVKEENVYDEYDNPFNPFMQGADGFFPNDGGLTSTQTNWIYRLIDFAIKNPKIVFAVGITMLMAAVIFIGAIESKQFTQPNCIDAKNCNQKIQNNIFNPNCKDHCSNTVIYK